MIDTMGSHVGLLVVLWMLQTCGLCAAQYTLKVTRPTGSNHITLKCRQGITPGVNVTFWRTLSANGSDWKVVATGHKYNFIMRPSLEGFYFCGNYDQPSAGSDRSRLLSKPRIKCIKMLIQHSVPSGATLC